MNIHEKYYTLKEINKKFLRVANPKYIDVLMKGPKISMVFEEERIENNVVGQGARTYPKYPKTYSPD